MSLFLSILCLKRPVDFVISPCNIPTGSFVLSLCLSFLLVAERCIREHLAFAEHPVQLDMLNEMALISIFSPLGLLKKRTLMWMGLSSGEVCGACREDPQLRACLVRLGVGGHPPQQVLYLAFRQGEFALILAEHSWIPLDLVRKSTTR